MRRGFVTEHEGNDKWKLWRKRAETTAAICMITLLLCSHVREGVAACTWEMSCRVSTLSHGEPSTSACVHHFLPQSWPWSPEPLFSYVRGHKAFIISVEHAWTGPPGSAVAPLLPRWSALCHHPNKASYSLFYEQLGNNWKQHLSVLLTYTA